MSGKPQIDGCRVVALGDAWAYGQGQITWNELEARAHAAPAEAQGDGEASEGWHAALDSASDLVSNAPDARYRKRAEQVRDWIKSRPDTPPSAPVGVDDIAVELEYYANCPGRVLALAGKLRALAQQPAAPRNSSGHCPDSSGHSRVESILLRAGFNPDEAARIAARAVQQGGPTR